MKYILVLVTMCVAGVFLLGVSTSRFEYSYEVVMPARYDSVWKELTTPDSLPSWYPELVSVSVDSGQYDQAPALFSWEMILDGAETSHEVRLIKYDKPDTVEYIHFLPEAEKKIIWALKPLTGRNTKVTGTYEWQPHGLMNRITYRFNSLSLGYSDQTKLESLRDHLKESKNSKGEK